MKDKNLLQEALIKLLSGIVLVGLLLFLPAGTLAWKRGWLFMGLLFLPMILAGIVMYIKAPNLLRSRLKAKETQTDQKDVIKLSGLMFLAAFTVAGLNYRFGWTALPKAVTVVGCAVFLLSYANNIFVLVHALDSGLLAILHNYAGLHSNNRKANS